MVTDKNVQRRSSVKYLQTKLIALKQTDLYNQTKECGKKIIGR